MEPPDYTLAFFRSEQDMVSVHADVRGLDVLIASLQRIKAQIEAGVCDHDHLISASCAGGELSEIKGSETGTLVHHVKIYGWTQEWIAKHGFEQ